MHKGKGVVGAVGTGMFAIFLATVQQRYFGSPSHPTILFWSMVVCGITWAICAAVWVTLHFLAQSNSPNAPGTPTFNIQNAPVFTNSQVIDQKKSPADDITTADFPSPKKRLNVLAVETRKLAFKMGQWYPDEKTGLLNLIVWIENPAAAEGEECPPIYGLFASATYRNLSGDTLGQTSRTYWFKHEYNTLGLEAGHREAIVLGCPYLGGWTIFDNRNEAQVWIGRRRTSTHPPATRSEFPFEDRFMIDVALVESGTWKTLRKFRIGVERTEGLAYNAVLQAD